MENIVSITINNWPLDKPIPHIEINCIPSGLEPPNSPRSRSEDNVSVDGPESCLTETQFRDDLNGSLPIPGPRAGPLNGEGSPEMKSFDRAKKLCDELHADGKHITVAMLKQKRLQPNGRYEGLGNSTIAAVKDYKNKLNAILKEQENVEN